MFAKYKVTGEPKIFPFIFVAIKHTEHLGRGSFDFFFG